MSGTNNYKTIFDLRGRKAIVTGGSRGIGKALAEALAAHGADVAIVVRSSMDRAEVLVNELKATGVDSFAIQADVSVEADVQRMTDAVIARWGRIDILVNNAGIVLPAAAEECGLDTWRQTMAVNLDGVFLVSQIVGRQMIVQKSGSIINIGSMSGRIVNWPFRHAAYNVSKAGVHMLTKCLATEWAEHGIRVNAIAPGYIRTELTDEVLKEHPDVVRDHWAKGAVQNRIGGVEELAGAAVYLASDAASFTTGEIMTIDGGLTLR
ncbi:SDR family NAD(P)-dependent oxidoreductase [Agrobacterium rubi]|uniref:SDR family oxidoreductase n=1 Tax=Agrobacterium rubi TaxID=28099 RepID=A0AAE7R9L2_9HYPH|nr:SDR family oxidoreductase [Agrobacterium rubi]NTE88376.1 SDR family oxidoreductase [Agrobacterium rubi]NTF04142.1 SDR family oxidoreductase [Agrobacterium rubi]NTF38473.1 SDR family oxidoreductase [Agrobacterium rubi]OCJ47140.1 short-chain dehydrogenase [Agrobacterium rubi]QTG02282.1 SDR family oxidoreductase [Agrobacterium rubi]